MRNNGSWFWMPGILMLMVITVVVGCSQKEPSSTTTNAADPDSVVIATIRTVYNSHHLELPTCWDSIAVALPGDFVDEPGGRVYNGYTWTDQVNSPDFQRIAAVTSREYMYRPLYDRSGHIYSFELYCLSGQAVYNVYNGLVSRWDELVIVHRIRDLAKD